MNIQSSRFLLSMLDEKLSNKNAKFQLNYLFLVEF